MSELNDRQRWQTAQGTTASNQKTGRDKKTAQVTSPYNFIEPPDKVADTPWAEIGPSGSHPSHATPYPEGISGTIDIDWTFETPFLIGAADKVKIGDKDYSVHVEYDGKKVIPGSSIRGMLRNVLEIASASRVIHIDREARFSFRDWERGSDLGEQWLKAVHEGTPNNINHIKGGFLVPPCIDALNEKKPEYEKWKLIPCTTLARVDKDEAYTAIKGVTAKLPGWEDLSTNERYQHMKPEIHGTIRCRVGSRKNYDRRGANWPQAAPVLADSRPFHPAPGAPSMDGHVALVGHGANNSSWLFIAGADEPQTVDVPDSVIENFISAHSGITGGRGALDFWRTEIKKDGNKHIPVVYVDRRPAGRAANIKANEFFISLSRFLKMPHLFSVGEMAEQSAPAFHRNDEGALDFVQALFGHVPPDDVEPDEENPQTLAWKTRVFFRHATLKNFGQELLPVPKTDCVTESPRPSFSPYYLRPNQEDSANHWSDKKTRLAGVKRYPVRKKTVDFSNGDSGNSVHMQYLIGKGISREVVFTAPLKLHNLHPVELGGLLWAIFFTRPDAKEPWRHAMGRGKPQGHGRLRGELSDLELETCTGKKLSESDLNGYVEKFETWLKNELNEQDFDAIEHIRELRAMADPEIGHTLTDQLQYPVETGNSEEDKSLKGYGVIKAHAKADPSLHLWRYPRSRK